jgi:16S rRNA (guanine527-N7)-methyltransferase
MSIVHPVHSVPPRQLFHDFLRQHFGGDADRLLAQFEKYLQELYEWNRKVNLVSRKMPVQDYWTHHFLDSLLVFNCMDIKSGEVLDFGTGGGLPGLPVKLARPELRLTLLDSVGKKIRCLQELIAALSITDCEAVWSRLEDYSGRRFDLVLCRSVRLEPAFIAPLHRLLKEDGKVVFYKAQQLDDVSVLPEISICDVSRPELGTRQMVIAPRRSFEAYLKTNRHG